MKKLLLISLAIILSCLLYVLYQTLYTTKSSNDQLTVGMIIGYAPFAMIKEDGSYEGFDVEVAQKIAQKLNKQLIIKDMDLPALLIALEQNKLDLVLTGLSITPEREKVVTMVHYAGDAVTTYPLVFWQRIPPGIKSLENLLTHYPDAIICIEPGSTQEQFVQSQVPTQNMLQIESMVDIVMNLKYGKAVAAVLDPDLFPAFKRQYPELIAVDINLPKEYQTRGIGIAINKHNAPLIKQVRTIIDQFKKDGTLNRLYSKWLGI